MSYDKHTWETGQIITATDMNHIEDGIENLDSQINDSNTGINKTLTDLDDQINNNTTGIDKVLTDLNNQVNGTSGISDSLNSLNTQINGTNGITSQISDMEDDIDSIQNTLLNGIKFGGIFFTAQDIPTEPYFGEVIGKICYILDDNGTYKVLSGYSDTSRSIEIYCHQDVDSEFYSCQLIPPSSTHIFVAFIPNSTISDYGNLVFSGEISNTTIDIEDSSEGEGTDSTATTITVQGRLISGIGNILFTYNPTQQV